MKDDIAEDGIVRLSVDQLKTVLANCKSEGNEKLYQRAAVALAGKIPRSEKKRLAA